MQVFSKYLKIFLSTILLLGILLSFAGVGDVFSLFSNKNLVAKVGSYKITKDDLDLAVQNAQEELMQGNRVDFDKLDDNQKTEFKKMVFDNLINEKLMSNFAKDLGIVVSDEVVAKQIKGSPVFSNPETGVFDKQKFNETLLQFGKSEREYIDDMKEGLGIYGLFLALNIKTKIDLNTENELLAKHIYRKRLVDLIKIESDAIEVPQPTIEEAKKFYDNNQKNFRQSGLRSIKYFLINKNDFNKNVKVDEVAIKKDVENILNGLESKETRSFFSSVCNNEEDSKKIHDHFSAMKADDYKSAIGSAKNIEHILYNDLKLSSCNLIEMNDKKINDLPEEFRSMIFKEININKMVGNPKKTTAGNQIILLKDIKEIKSDDFEKKVREEYINNAAKLAARDEFKKILQTVDKDTTIDGIAKIYNKKVEILDYFDDDGYFKNNKKYVLEGLKNFNRDFIELAFKLKSSDIKGIEGQNDEFIIMELNENQAPIDETIKNFDNVKEGIIADLLREKQELEAGNIVEKVFTDYNSGLKIDDLQKKYSQISFVHDANVNNPELISMTGGGTSVDYEIAKMIFDSSKKDGDAIKIDNLNQIAILRGWSDANDNQVSSNSLKEMISNNIYAAETSEMTNALIKNLKKRYKIKIFSKNIE